MMAFRDVSISDIFELKGLQRETSNSQPYLVKKIPSTKLVTSKIQIHDNISTIFPTKMHVPT